MNKYTVKVSHDMFNKGRDEFMIKRVTEEELKNLKKSKVFKIVSCQEFKEN